MYCYTADMSSGYLSAKQASQKLGVSLSTLYAYVSRGLIRSEPDSVKRRRRYRAEDVEALLHRKSERTTVDRALGSALSWGEPVGESELTLVSEGELYYRGRSVTQLAAESTFEEVVELLWQGYAPEQAEGVPDELHPILGALEPIQRFACLLPWVGHSDPRAYDLRPEGVRRAGSRILNALFSSVCDVSDGVSLAHGLAQEWSPAHRGLLEAALILVADHELNVSTFTARCVASSGATPYQVVTAAMAAMSGFRHGGYAYQVEALFREAEALGPERAVTEYLKRGATLPGFGHQLYPQGDPRGRDLLAMFTLCPVAEGLVRAAVDMLEEKPNIDFALVALSRVLCLPFGAPLAIFALGRCAGWIAHALEQYSTGKLIRPRARYVGVTP